MSLPRNPEGDTAPGAVDLGDGMCRFRVWAPAAKRAAVEIESPRPRTVDLEDVGSGYFQAEVEAVPGTEYRFRLDGGEPLPDPASRHQPRGVHAASRVIDRDFPWMDGDWKPPPLADFILYELHVGTFSPEGTFDGVARRLQDLVDLGVTAVELMPVAQFPGTRNWGYDGVYPYAVQESYGGPDGLRRLVDACHAHGLAVVLDVVYNHLGPEGNYLRRFGPYFTDAYRTPWGDALNFDGPDSDPVRSYFIENALTWADAFHIDALRLDAVHAILDRSAYHFLHELADRCRGRILLIAESDANDPRLLGDSAAGGFGLDGQWLDDYHHALHAVLTGERQGYYADFGEVDHVARSLQKGFVYSGQYSRFRRRRHGHPVEEPDRSHLVVFSQNHDQVGNRMNGDRLLTLVPREAAKLAAGAVLLSPFIPLLFMGEEYGETAPFQYFTSHSDPDLVEAVRRGRREEFAAFHWQGEPPDPQDPATFERSRLTRDGDPAMHAYYRSLIALRKELGTRLRDRNRLRVESRDPMVWVRWGDHLLLILNFDRAPGGWRAPEGRWATRLDSAHDRWGGPGGLPPVVDGGRTLTVAPASVALLQAE